MFYSLFAPSHPWTGSVAALVVDEDSASGGKQQDVKHSKRGIMWLVTVHFPSNTNEAKAFQCFAFSRRKGIKWLCKSSHLYNLKLNSVRIFMDKPWHFVLFDHLSWIVFVVSIYSRGWKHALRVPRLPHIPFALVSSCRTSRSSVRKQNVLTRISLSGCGRVEIRSFSAEQAEQYAMFCRPNTMPKWSSWFGNSISM